MNFNYIKTFATVAMMTGAMAFALPAMAADEPAYPEVELSVNPATSVVETIDKIEITFEGVEHVEWAVTGTENAPYLENVVTGERAMTFSNLSGKDNVLILSPLADEFDVKGEYKVIIPAGSYVFPDLNNLAGEEIVLNFEVLGLTGYSVEPSMDVLSEIQNLKITFHEAAVVTLSEELGTMNSPVLYLLTEDGERERRATFFPEAVGNNLLLTMNTAIADEGEYVVEIPGSTYYLDGAEGADIELFYTIVAPSYPEVELIVNPATDVVDAIDTIEITFDGVETVEWAVTGTENSPYLENVVTGERAATFVNLGGYGNMLSLSMLAEEYAVKGEYKVVIPEGSYVFQGIYHGMPGKEIVLNYEVLGIEGVTIEPAVNVQTELQNFRVTFNGATEVTLAEDLGTTNTPYLMFCNESGEWERRDTLYPSVVGNAMILTTYSSPITEPGEYKLVIPGSVYFVDGMEGEDLEFSYTVIEDNQPINFTIEPAPGVVAYLQNFEVTFDDADEVNWNYEEMESNLSLCPTIAMEGEEAFALHGMTSKGNVLYLAPLYGEEWTALGEYVLTIPGGSYFINGEEGKTIVVEYTVDGGTGVGSITVNGESLEVYDLNGRKVMSGADASALKQLRGIFVVNGKKYILR